MNFFKSIFQVVVFSMLLSQVAPALCAEQSNEVVSTHSIGASLATRALGVLSFFTSDLRGKAVLAAVVAVAAVYGLSKYPNWSKNRSLQKELEQFIAKASNKERDASDTKRKLEDPASLADTIAHLSRVRAENQERFKGEFKALERKVEELQELNKASNSLIKTYEKAEEKMRSLTKVWDEIDELIRKD